MTLRDRRSWAWLPGRLRFRVLGLIDVVALWALVAVLTGAGAWWGIGSYRHHRDYCTAGQELRRTGPDGECIGVTARAYPFAPGLRDVLGRIATENTAARTSGRPVVSVAVVMPFTANHPGAAMSEELIRHSLQGAYVAQHAHNHGPATADTAVQLLFANVGEDLGHWRTVTDELAARSAAGTVAPVVAAIGFPNSDTRTLDSVRKGLAPAHIPAVSAVLSSRDMESPYLFKVSPSTDQLVDALKRYVSANGVDRDRTFMVADSREDNYVTNLRDVFRREFGAAYGITDDAVDRRIEYYRGIKGPAAGTPQIFRRAVSGMCADGTRTVFFAGRDADLPPFLRTIDSISSCDRAAGEEPLRILRVSTGRDPVTETKGLKELADRDGIEIVTAAAVDAPRWRAGRGRDEQVPKAFGAFARAYDGSFTKEPRDALNDGYAVMFHDALTAVGTAVAAVTDNGVPAVGKDDVHGELGRGSPLGHCAATCVPGAGGVFTFADEDATGSSKEHGTPGERASGLWPVCKPVPVVTFPEERRDRSPLYRTYQKPGTKTCPLP
ncbi:hypothetical protein GTW43_19330 [Streptomyces sp. SID5785]|uniref:hypothetical protein n=1 Tax=Streptomyces sp. SID5785 TaxID=2690309 RepID=UPI001361F391|nr:hypothetical protein [Streptomyces sp. SID5785]MZD07222.1 hypothetical protein [Streptomyces sp. SID5785]